MGRAGAPWPGAAKGGSVRAALLAGVLAAGCGPTGPPPAPASPSAPSPSASLSPGDLCTRVVAPWVRELLAGGDTYGDYQSMGLSNRQYDVLREVVDAARAVRDERGDDAAVRSADRLARERCAARYRDGGPSEGPWQR
ncbi:hypothetical protein [Streptomyces daghestanicus]|uniref:hypothetical protein n=1 Tax=Streptomyces daghestanicus TaxID=66885 RepID=UPI00167EFEA9|nr:hypothetical protein [Streptomyces daghestanicus]